MFQAKIIAHSISPKGKEILTWELSYPRFIHCFDGETEILSQVRNEPPKFRSFEAVKALGAKVAQFDENTEEISFVMPIAQIEQEGNHRMVSLNKDKFPMKVTAGHRVHTRKRTTNNIFVNDTILASEFLGGSYGTRRILQSGSLESKQILTNSELEFVAWFVSDGHKPIQGNKSNFHFKKQRKVNEVCRVLKDCGYGFELSSCGEEFVIRFENNPLVELCYTEDRKKVIPDVAMEQSQEGYTLFKRALLLSDGNLDSGDYNNGSEELINQIQVLAHTHNDSMNIKKYGSLFKCRFKKENYISLRHDKDVFEESYYSGKVYCVTVPTSYVVVRRKGVVFISGNCEVMTHRMLSKNAASSRAIPVQKMIDMVRENPAMPVHWGKNQPGMQANEELDQLSVSLAKMNWEEASLSAANYATHLAEIGVHKQIVNRILEPFQWMKTVMTGTEWANFYWLRNHPDSQPEFQHLAKMMWDEQQKSVPTLLNPGDWHLPYYENGYWKYEVDCDCDGVKFESDYNLVSLEDAMAISMSCCAQVSYRVLDDTIDKAKRVVERLNLEGKNGEPVHASPSEHQATPMQETRITGSGDWEGWVNTPLVDTWEDGITAYHKELGFMSGNLAGWIQKRQLIKGSTVW